MKRRRTDPQWFFAMLFVYWGICCTPEGGLREGPVASPTPSVTPEPALPQPQPEPSPAREGPGVAIIGWGSLIWRPESLQKQGDFHAGGPTLPVAFSRVSNGQSCPGCLTLVIDVPSDGPGRKPSDNAGRDVKTWYARSSFPYTQMDLAIKNLTEREGAKLSTKAHKPNPIGYVDLNRKEFRISQIDPTNGKTETINGKIQQVADDVNGVEIVAGSGLRREIIPYLKGLIAWTAAKRFEAAIWTDLQRNFKEKTGKKFNQENAKSHLLALPLAVRTKALEYIERAPIHSQTRDGDALVDVLEHSIRE